VIEPFQATYRFGWEGIPAGGAVVEISQGTSPSNLWIEAEGGPDDFIRKLWNYHAHYVGEAGKQGETPSWFRMDEAVSRGDLMNTASFTNGEGISCRRLLTEDKPWKLTHLPGMRDLFAAMLFARSQPLLDGDRIRLVVFPDANPYLVDLQVVKREIITVCGKKVPAVRFKVGIMSIATEGPQFGKLTPHRKFRSGRVWMSDDVRRLPLKAEVDIFVGAVYAELVSITPEL
jgi:hypothetical protein